MDHVVGKLRRHADASRENYYRGLGAGWLNLARDDDRAADLVEALSNPPETVEELERRGQELTATLLQAGRHEATGLIGVYWETGDSVEYVSATSIRAAWFAIVGVMEVGRG